MNECKYCEFFDLFNNVCFLNNSKGYENKKCLHENCKNYKETTWRPQSNNRKEEV